MQECGEGGDRLIEDQAVAVGYQGSTDAVRISQEMCGILSMYAIRSPLWKISTAL